MNLIEFKTLNASREVPTRIWGEMLTNKSDRTLLWGYTCDRLSFHIYMRDGKIGKVVYAYGEHQLGTVTHEPFFLHDLTPDKRLYPEACDFEFCMMLKEKGVWLPFTTWDDERADRRLTRELLAPATPYHGHIAETVLGGQS